MTPSGGGIPRDGFSSEQGRHFGTHERYRHEQQLKKLFRPNSSIGIYLERRCDFDVHVGTAIPSIMKALHTQPIPHQFVPKTSSDNDRNCAFWMFPRSVASKVQSVLYGKNVLPPREKSCNRGEIPATTLKVFHKPR